MQQTDEHSPPPPPPVPSSLAQADEGVITGHDSASHLADYMHSYFGSAPGSVIELPPPPPQPPSLLQTTSSSADENSSDLVHAGGFQAVSASIPPAPMYHHPHREHHLPFGGDLCNGGALINGGGSGSGFTQYMPPAPQPSSAEASSVATTTSTPVTIHLDSEDTEDEKHEQQHTGEERGVSSEVGSNSSSSVEAADPKQVEVSVVGSPTVFGIPQPQPATPESDDERVIERCDILGSDQLSLPTGVGDSPADHRPPKKRFMHNAPDVPVPPGSLPSHPHHHLGNSNLSPSAFGAIPGMFDGLRGEEPGDVFQQAMCNWQWVHLDGIKIPVVNRHDGTFAAVHIVQLKFLSKFPPNIPLEMTQRYTMVSQKMTVMESWIFNTINAVMCKFDLGCQLFTVHDEIVRFADVERFYWAVKALNLRRILDGYENELRNTSPFNFALLATIQNLKKTIEDDLEDVKHTLSSLH